MKLLEKLSKGLSVIILVACVAVFVLFGLSATGWKALAVPTGSMRPHITPGSLVFVHRVPVSSLKVGDVITYSTAKPGITISHRIIKTYSMGGKIPGFVTKGDANKLPDVPIAGGSIVGRVVWHVPRAGSWLMGGKTWVSIVLLVYLPALILLVDEMRRLSTYYKSKLPYRLYGFGLVKEEIQVKHRRPAFVAAGTLAVVLAVVGLAFAEPTFALLRSNQVTLGPNTLTAAGNVTTTPPTCGGDTNDTNVNISDSSTQTATSGQASNTNGGTATSGSASNSNSSSFNVSISNGC